MLLQHRLLDNCKISLSFHREDFSNRLLTDQNSEWPYFLPKTAQRRSPATTNSSNDNLLDFIFSEHLEKIFNSSACLVPFWDDGKVGALLFLVAGVFSDKKSNLFKIQQTWRQRYWGRTSKNFLRNN
eukprot:Pompholyxophrys_punicea_v1_NODE_924_length_1134_cov_4.220575.p1 type:complete len:127 gc:universal NODE_924_length_1134_cov_4.220575:175-555(+)